jgi:hypothetical protein
MTIWRQLDNLNPVPLGSYSQPTIHSREVWIYTSFCSLFITSVPLSSLNALFEGEWNGSSGGVPA